MTGRQRTNSFCHCLITACFEFLQWFLKVTDTILLSVHQTAVELGDYICWNPAQILGLFAPTSQGYYECFKNDKRWTKK